MKKEKKFLLSIIIKLHCLPTKTPEFTLCVNHQELECVSNNNNMLTYNVFTPLGNNHLSINFKNRSENDTIIDHQGCILHDHAIELYQVSVDDTDCTHLFKKMFVVNSVASTVNHYGYLNVSGIGTVDFVNPPFYWERNLNLIKNQHI